MKLLLTLYSLAMAQKRLLYFNESNTADATTRCIWTNAGSTNDRIEENGNVLKILTTGQLEHTINGVLQYRTALSPVREGTAYKACINSTGQLGLYTNGSQTKMMIWISNLEPHGNFSTIFWKMTSGAFSGWGPTLMWADNNPWPNYYFNSYGTPGFVYQTAELTGGAQRTDPFLGDPWP